MNYTINMTINPMTFGSLVTSKVIHLPQFAQKVAAAPSPTPQASTSQNLVFKTQRIHTHQDLARSGYITICESLVAAGSKEAQAGMPYEALIPIPYGVNAKKMRANVYRSMRYRQPSAKFSFKSKNVKAGFIRVIRFK